MLADAGADITRGPRSSAGSRARRPRSRARPKRPDRAHHDRVAHGQRRRRALARGRPRSAGRRHRPPRRPARALEDAAAISPTIAARRGIPVLRVRILLSGGAGPLVGPDAPSARSGSRSSSWRATSSTPPRAPATALLLAGMTLANQIGAVLVHRASDDRTRKRIMAVTVAVDLGVARAVQVLRLLRRRVRPLAGLDRAGDAAASADAGPADRAVVHHLPGDLLRGRRQARPAARPPRRSTSRIYLSFFPHVVAGPIVRAREFIPQLAKPRDPRNVAVGAGRGADRARPGQEGGASPTTWPARWWIPVFGVPEAYAAPDVALAAYAYAAQIYCDFSGLHRHRDRRGAADGLRVPAELQQPLPGHELPRLLAALAHDALALPARLPLHPAGRQPRREVEDRAQPDDHDGAGRPLARCRLGLRAVGDAARLLAS